MLRMNPAKRAIAAAPIWCEAITQPKIAEETVAGDQPNSCSSGTINMLGVARTAAVTTSVTNVTAATTHRVVQLM